MISWVISTTTIFTCILSPFHTGRKRVHFILHFMPSFPASCSLPTPGVLWLGLLLYSLRLVTVLHYTTTPVTVHVPGTEYTASPHLLLHILPAAIPVLHLLPWSFLWNSPFAITWVGFLRTTSCTFWSGLTLPFDLCHVGSCRYLPAPLHYHFVLQIFTHRAISWSYCTISCTCHTLQLSRL